MPDFIGNIEVPEIVPAGTFPVKPDYGHGLAQPVQVVIHQFGSGNAKIEQRFLLGPGAKRFTVRKAALNETDRVALRDFWENAGGPYGAFTYNAPNDDGDGTTAYTVRFANEPLSWEFLSDAISSAGVTLIEIPNASPVYALNSTLTRFPSAGLQAALLGQAQQVIPLVAIRCREAGYPAIYVSDRRCTVGGQLYLARLLEFDGISQSIGNESDEAQFSFGNADRVMRDLSNDTDLFRASIEFSLFHVGTGIKIDLWKGELIDWQYDDGPAFRVAAADGIYELTLPYPTRRISRTCWKNFNDGAGCPYAAQSTGLDPGADANACDKGYDTPNGCRAHGMKRYFGGVIAEPQGVRIKDNSTGTWGYKRSSITSVSLVSESIYDEVVPEIYTDSPMPVNCKIAAGREESDFYNALGIVGEGPLTFGSGHKLDGQLHHGYPGLEGLRYAQGLDPALAGDKFSLGPSYKDNFSAGTAFLELRRHDEKGLQLTQVSGHDMQAVVATGLQGWVWAGPGARNFQTLTNPVWITVNAMLRARGLRYADAAAAEQHFDVASAVAAAGVCDLSVPKLIGTGNETQFRFRGVLQEEKPLRDWIQEILMNCLGFYTFIFGKLKLGVRANSSAAEAFTEGNILFQSLQLSAARPSFNHLAANFADEEFEFAANAISVYDIDHAKTIGGATAPQFLKSSMNLSGCSSKSQAARLITARLREELGGISAEHWRKARQISFGTTVLALNTEAGMVCSMTHPNMPDGAGEFRIQGWRLNRDFSIAIQGRTTVDEMYDMVVGPKPADVDAAPLPVEPAGWNQRSVGGKAVAGVGNAAGTPTLTELFVQDDGNPDLYYRKIKVEFTPPPTAYADTLARRAQISTPAVLAAGGSIPGDQTLYVEVCAQAGGVDGLASDPLEVVIPAGTNTNRFTIQCRLPDAAMTHYRIRVGPRVGRMFALGAAIASPGTNWFEISVTDISALDSASLSPDPRFHHVRVFYFYDGSPETIRDGGTTSGPADSELIFQPEPPEAGDTKLTVVLCSENLAETDRYPYGYAPAAELVLTKDTGNPAGASGLQILTSADDAKVPPGMMVFQLSRDTLNYRSIYGVEVRLSAALPGQGPYSVERAAFPGSVIEGPIAVTVVAGSRGVACARAASASVVGRPLVIFTNDGTPDSDLEGNIVWAQGLNYYELDRPFTKSGSYTGYVLKRWWDLGTAGETANGWYEWFPVEKLGDVVQAAWRTPPVPYPVGTFHATACSRNLFGVGTRITAGPKTFVSTAVPADAVLPGAVRNFRVAGAGGTFKADWDDPLAGANSLDDCVIQYATDAGFTQNVVTASDWGKRNHLEGTDPDKTYFFRIAVHNRSGVASDAAVGAAVTATGHDGATGWGPWVAFGAPTSVYSGPVKLAEAQVDPEDLSGPARSQHGVFFESFETVPNWQTLSGAGTTGNPANGIAGGKVLQVAGDLGKVYGQSIPFDPSKLYRMRWRVRWTAAVDAGKFYAYLGLRGYAADGVTLVNASDAYDTYCICASAEDLHTQAQNAWIEYTGWFKGTNAACPGATERPNADTPGPLHPNTRYIRPAFYVNRTGGPAGNVTEIDEVAIDVFDEESQRRIYNAVNSDFTIVDGRVVPNSIAEMAVTADKLSAEARAQYGVFNEAFDTASAAGYTENSGSPGTVTFPASGQTGGYVLRAAGHAWKLSNQYLPFDPNRLYRIRVRIRRIATTDAAKQKVYAGVEAYRADKSYRGGGYYPLSNFDASALVLDQWYQYTGWIKKNSTDAYAGAGTPTNPSLLPSVVSYIRPTFILNDSLGPAGNVMEIDQLCIDAFDEDGQNRLYLAIASAGTIATDKVIETSITNNAITTNKIAASSVVAGKISVAQLSALTTDIGSVTAGTVTGATVRTASGYPRIEMNSSELKAINSSNAVTLQITDHGLLRTVNIQAIGASSPNIINLTSDGAYALYLQLCSSYGNRITTSAGDLDLRSFTGIVSFGTYSAGAVAQAGYITIKDAGGTTRRLLVG